MRPYIPRGMYDGCRRDNACSGRLNFSADGSLCKWSLPRSGGVGIHDAMDECARWAW
jgi:hypothetical protein